MKANSLAAVFLLLYAPIVASETIDGRAWADLNTSYKITYLRGIYDGKSDLSVKLVSMANLSDKPRSGVVLRDYLAKELCFDPAGFDGQIVVNRLDSFYSDYKNIYIPATDALCHTMELVKGLSSEKAEKNLEVMRKLYSPDFKIPDNRD